MDSKEEVESIEGKAGTSPIGKYDEKEELRLQKLRVSQEANQTDAWNRRPKTHHARWRLEINKLLNEPKSGYIAQAVALTLTLLILGSVTVLILSTVDQFKDDDDVFFECELAFSILFTIELALRLMVQYDTVHSVMKDPYFYIDTFAVLPFYVEAATSVKLPDIIKGIRIVRLFKLARQFQGSITLVAAVEESIAALMVPTFFLVVSATTFGVFMYYVEEAGASAEAGIEPAFANIPETIWFIFVTMTTVGYGDIYPNSTIGKLLNIVAMYFGVLFLSMPLAILGNNFCNVWMDRDRVTIIARMREALLQGGSTKDSVQKAFMKIDLDGSGSINFKEFVVAIKTLNIDMNIKALQKLWRSIDSDGSGEIMVEEFAELVFPDMDGFDTNPEDMDGLDAPPPVTAVTPGADVSQQVLNEITNLNKRVDAQAQDLAEIRKLVQAIAEITQGSRAQV